MNDYEKTIRVHAGPEAVHSALATTAGLSAWWTRATGTGRAGGELRFWFDHPEPLVMHVDQVTAALVRWRVTDCAFLPEWVGTRPTFAIAEIDPERCEIQFRHHGLTPALECIDMCTRGWNHFIPSLGRYLETGAGNPHGSPADLARHEQQAAESELRAFFAKMSAVDRGGASADQFHDQFFSLDPSTANVVTREQLRAALPMRARMFDSIGAAGTRLRDLDVTRLDALHVLAHTTWDVLFEDAGQEPLQLDSSYLLRRFDGDWRILVYLNHQDIEAKVLDR